MDSFHALPIGSIYAYEEKMSVGYLSIAQDLPVAIKGLIASTETASYIKGLSRTYDIPEDNQPAIAFAILEVAIDKKTFAQLPAILSTELQLPNDKAQKMAAEIEKDVFGPVRAELDEFLSRKAATQPRDTAVRNSLQNVLNLKELPAKKPQASLPPRPVQKDLPVGKPQPPNKPIRFT